MRPYRGKRKDNGEWVYGWLIKDAHGQCFIADTGISSPPISARPVKSLTGSHDIVIIGAHKVDPATVDQQIGEQDKHKKEIYQGDKVKIMTHYDRIDGKHKYRLEVATSGCRCGLNTNGLVSIQKEGRAEYEPQLEIIGTIHDK